MNQVTLPSASQRGFVLVGVLIALALLALMAVNTGQHMADTRLRAGEAELLDIGEQYRRAIESYRSQSPGGVRSLPLQLQDLVLDPRFPQPRRHLRKLYKDPIAPDSPWGVVRLGNGIVGVYSQAEGMPFRQTGFSELQLGFDNAQKYADWRFVVRTAPAPSAPGRGAPLTSPGVKK